MRSTTSFVGSAAVAGAAAVLVAGAAAAATTRFEVESTPAVCQGTIDTDWVGYSGSGFCNSTNAIGAAAQFTVNVAAAGTASVAVRFANGTTTGRPADLIVNGATVQSVPFEGTGAWNTWVTRAVSVPVRAGANTIRLAAGSSAGLANIDYIELTPADPPPPPPPGADTLYVSPSGTTGAAGTPAEPTTLASAITRVPAGGTILLRGGTYAFSQPVTVAVGNDGTANARKAIAAYPGETPVLNFSAMAEDPANRGLTVNGSYWHVTGVVVERAGDNGIFVGGSHNILERTVTRFNADTGLQLSRAASTTPRDRWPAGNLVISAESHDNADSDGEDADGFAAKLTVGPGNVFRYAVSHHNIDDGWDLFTKTDTGAIGPVTVEDSLAYANGTLSNGGQAGNGDRNGFKLGGDGIAVDHVIRRNIAFRNGKHGFTYNRNLGTMTVANNLAIDNTERNYSFDGGSSVFRNNTSCRGGSGPNDRTIGNADGSNEFWTGVNASRCAGYAGALGWSFAPDGRLVVTLGGRTVTP